MITKKKLLAGFLFGYFNPIFRRVFCSINKEWLSLLAYHRVYPMKYPDFPFYEDMISATPDEFNKQMAFVSKNFNVINFKILDQIISSGNKLPSNSLIVTFDDGYADNFEMALPVMNKYGITATIFVTINNVESQKTYWFEKIVYQMKKMTPRELSLNSRKFKVDKYNRMEMAKSIIAFLMEVPEPDRIVCIKELDMQTGIDVSSSDLEYAKPLTWEMIKNLDKAGIEIGSHTLTHPILSKMSDEDIINELSESKRILEDKIGKEVISISYPVGNKNCYDHRVLKFSECCGYRFGVSYKHSVERLNPSNTFEIPRVHVETDVSFPLFQANLLLPKIFL